MGNKKELLTKVESVLSKLSELGENFQAIGAKFIPEMNRLRSEKDTTIENLAKDLASIKEKNRDLLSSANSRISDIQSEMSKFQTDWDSNARNQISNIEGQIADIKAEIQQHSGGWQEYTYKNRIADIERTISNIQSEITRLQSNSEINGKLLDIEGAISTIRHEITKYSGDWKGDAYKSKMANIKNNSRNNIYAKRAVDKVLKKWISGYAIYGNEILKWFIVGVVFILPFYIIQIPYFLIYDTIPPNSLGQIGLLLGALLGWGSHVLIGIYVKKASSKIESVKAIMTSSTWLSHVQVESLKRISNELKEQIDIEAEYERNDIEAQENKIIAEHEKMKANKVSKLSQELQKNELQKDEIITEYEKVKTPQIANLNQKLREQELQKNEAFTENEKQRIKILANLSQKLQELEQQKNQTIDDSNKLKMQKLTDINQKLKKSELQKNEVVNDNAKIEAQQQSEYNQKLKDTDSKYNQAISALKEKANSDVQNIQSEVRAIIDNFNQLPESFSPSIDWNSENIMKGKDIVASNFRIGNEIITINIEGKEHKIEIPKYIPFVNKNNLVFNCKSAAETKTAVKISHNLVARALLALPPSKAKFTFIDPLELGGNAAPFTPLLRDIHGGMVYTEPNDIDNQLSTLKRTIANVSQKYLQDKFKDLADYNKHNDQVPEPYRFLVVYNFPHGFNETSANNLLSIIKSGPKSGVYTLLINDKNAKLPYGFDWNFFNEVNMQDITLTLTNDTNQHFEFDEDLPYGEIVEYINKELPNVSSIKVPFTKYIPPQSEWWKGEAHKQLSIPIGKHGTALQDFTLNNIIENNALLIGKSGSGKSNLLHVIIANLLWKYSPDQLEMYMVDFKEGLEFSIYADKQIPHIRAMALQSDREFGLSVLERIEKEMSRRANKFLEVGAKNLEEYHNKFPSERMPRLLLIVDEFQKFYDEDDTKQVAEKMYANIIKQGRAYGINSLFASQSLANTINKSIKDLVTIRIALMCSSDDSEIILGSSNSAAKDLTRPGEGIYNAENGRIEGNKRFQTFFIDEEDLKKRIDEVVEFSRKNKNNMHGKFEQRVFRGKEKAHIAKSSLADYNYPLNTNSTTFHLWLGQPIAMDNDVRAIFKRQGGNNLLIVGSDEDIAVRIIYSVIASLIKQPIHEDSTFYFFNFFDSDTNQFTKLKKLFEVVQSKFKVEFVEEQSIKTTLETVKTELVNRQQSSTSNFPNIFITAASVQRGRTFRKYSSSMTDEAKLLSEIIKDGANKGIHTTIQIDSMDSFGGKIFEDRLLPDFSQRVAMQMNDNNSRKLLGSDKAMKLGENRAYYFWDTENKLIKFKPYELPDMQFLE